MFVSLEELYYSWRMLHFQNTRKNFFNIPIKFRFCKRLGWSATERDGQTSSIIIKREYFHFSKTSQNIGWLNLWKELKQASRVLDLGLETTLLKFTQLCRQHLCQ